MTVYAPRTHARWPHVNWWLAATVCLTVVVAGLAGYAIAGGFTTESTSPRQAAADKGQVFADRVNTAWATGDPAAIRAAFAPDVKFLLEMPGEHVQYTNRAQVAAQIHSSIAAHYTYTQIGPVSSYSAADGDMYVSALLRVKGPGHPSGVPVVGFYRVHDGKVVRQIFMDAEHY